jgi:hypothetical protein
MTAELDVRADVAVSLGTVAREMTRARTEREQLSQVIYPVTIPAQFAVVAAAQTLVIANAELLGPRTGLVWDVRRVAVTGFQSTSEAVTLYRGSTGSSSDAQPENVIAMLTPVSSAVSVGTYSPGLGACLVRANQSLSLGGSGLTNGKTYTVTWDAINIPDEWVGAYLL